MIKKTILAILALGIFATSCSSDDDNGPTTSILTLNLIGLEPLGTDYVYEGWIIVDGAPVSTGTFTSVTFPQSFTVNTAQLNSATTFVLSIEPLVDSDPAPAATKAYSPTVTPHTNVQLAPRVAPFLTNVSRYSCFRVTAERGL